MTLLKQCFEEWGLKNIKLTLGFMETESEPKTADQDAAWELYVEMLTRILTQPLQDSDGDEQTALQSVHSLFPITREILRGKGRDCVRFGKVAKWC